MNFAASVLCWTVSLITCWSSVLSTAEAPAPASAAGSSVFGASPPAPPPRWSSALGGLRRFAPFGASPWYEAHRLLASVLKLRELRLEVLHHFRRNRRRFRVFTPTSSTSTNDPSAKTTSARPFDFDVPAATYVGSARRAHVGIQVRAAHACTAVGVLTLNAEPLVAKGFAWAQLPARKNQRRTFIAASSFSAWATFRSSARSASPRCRRPISTCNWRPRCPHAAARRHAVAVLHCLPGAACARLHLNFARNLVNRDFHRRGLQRADASAWP